MSRPSSSGHTGPGRTMPVLLTISGVLAGLVVAVVIAVLVALMASGSGPSEPAVVTSVTATFPSS